MSKIENKPGNNLIPTFLVPQGFLNSRAYIRHLVRYGLEAENGNADAHRVERMERELKTIEDRGIEDLILLYNDVQQWARSRGIWIGPGRAGAPGSLVNHVLKLTEIDPIEYDLCAEFFFDQKGKEIPAMDFDVQPSRRYELIQYIKSKYGDANVKAIGVPTKSSQIKSGKNTDDITYSSSLCGFVLACKPISEIVTLTKDKDSAEEITACHWDDLSTKGLVRLNFLDLKELELLHNLEQEIVKNHSGFKIMEIPEHDLKTYELFGNADTDGIFQFEYDHSKTILSQVKPETLSELCDVYALSFPGKTEMVKAYVAREEIPTENKLPANIKKILSSTRGLLLYKEQFFKILSEIASISYLESMELFQELNRFRKAAGKVTPDIFAKLTFKSGNEDQKAAVLDFLSTQAYDLIEKAQAISYMLLSYRLAYCKTHFPKEFNSISAVLKKSGLKEYDKIEGA